MKPELEIQVSFTPTGHTAIGNDLVYLPDFELSLTDLFKGKVYTADEIAYCDSFSEPLLRYASTWAAKEAVYKAVKQLSNHPLNWKHIVISRARPAGMPSVTLKNHPDAYHISLSISHDGEYAWAMALVSRLK